MNPLFIINFVDGESFIGGDYKNTKWKEIPNKKIKNIFYRLPNIDYLCLSGYEKYYHMIEATRDINIRSKERIEYAYIMGKLEDKVIIYKIDLYKNIGSIQRIIVNYNNNYIQKLNQEGWK